MTLQEVLNTFGEDKAFRIITPYGDVDDYVEKEDIEEYLDCEVETSSEMDDYYRIELKKAEADEDFMKLKAMFPSKFKNCYSDNDVKEQLIDMSGRELRYTFEGQEDQAVLGWFGVEILPHVIKVNVTVHLSGYDSDINDYTCESYVVDSWELISQSEYVNLPR